MTKQRTCASCANPAPDGVMICGRCERQTSHHLGDMEAHRAELEVTLSRQSRMAAGVTNGPEPTPTDPNIWDHRYSRPLRAHQKPGSANKPLVYSDQASAVLSAQRAILVSWSRLVHDDISHTWPREDSVASMALFIESHLPELRKHDAAGELVTEIRDLVRRIVRCIDYPDDRAKIHVGPCPEKDEDGEKCPGELRMHVPFTNDGKRIRVRCAACGEVWYPEQFNRLGILIEFDRAGARRLARAIAGAA